MCLKKWFSVDKPVATPPPSATITPMQPAQPTPTVQPTQAVKYPRIVSWGNMISRFEGAKPVLNNPGNLRYTTLTASWGAIDNGSFCQFSTYEAGFQALCNFLQLACEDQLIPYHNARTIKQFTEVYTDYPPPEYDYSDNLIKALNLTPETPISDFLS
jgi:hypothetical protein